MTEKTAYATATDASIKEHCERRGIPAEEVGSVRVAIKEKFGKALSEMDDGELRKVNRELPYILVDYLGGAKRRDLPAPTGDGGTTEHGSVSIV
jgi:hypothetical protein